MLVWDPDGVGPPVSFPGSAAPVSSVAFSQDGRHLAAAGGDRVVRLWDARTRQELHTFRGHTDWVTSVAFSPDGHFVVSAGVDRAVKVWELGGGEGTPGLGHTDEVRAVAVSPDGKRLATGAADGAVRVWDRATGRELCALAGHTSDVTALAFLDDKTLASAPLDKAILVWDAAAGKRLRSITEPGPANAVAVLAGAPDGKRVAAWRPSTQQNTVTRVDTYDVTDGKRIASLELSGPSASTTIACLTFSADGGVAAVGDNEGVVRLWDVAVKKQIGGDLRVTAGPVADLCLTPDKKTLVIADSQGWLKIWDLTRREPRKVKSGPGGEEADAVEAHKRGLACFAVAPDGARFATAGKDNVVKLWETSSGRLLREWDLKQPPLPEPNRGFVQGLAFTPDGKQLATANANTTAYLLDCP